MGRLLITRSKWTQRCVTVSARPCLYYYNFFETPCGLQDGLPRRCARNDSVCLALKTFRHATAHGLWLPTCRVAFQMCRVCGGACCRGRGPLLQGGCGLCCFRGHGPLLQDRCCLRYFRGRGPLLRDEMMLFTTQCGFFYFYPLLLAEHI